jgi:hypothetical protein
MNAHIKTANWRFISWIGAAGHAFLLPLKAAHCGVKPEAVKSARLDGLLAREGSSALRPATWSAETQQAPALP